MKRLFRLSSSSVRAATACSALSAYGASGFCSRSRADRQCDDIGGSRSRRTRQWGSSGSSSWRPSLRRAGAPVQVALCETPTAVLRDLYPPLEPFQSGLLETSDGAHELYYEVSGNPQGKPALFLHGGPGDGSSPKHRRLFDPKVFKIVTFDQRGAGKSLPSLQGGGLLEANTTAALVQDIEQLRKHLKIDAWSVVVGGSWGSTLALAYAQACPRLVRNLVVYSIFLPSRASIDWLYSSGGASTFYPDAYERFIGFLPPAERAAPIDAYYKCLLASADVAEKMAARASIARWVLTLLALTPSEEFITACIAEPEKLGDGSLIELHYMRNGCFLQEGQLLRDCTKISDIPCTILHGRYDLVCAPTGAWALHKALPRSTIEFVPESGHSSSAAPRLKSALIEAIDKFR
eukprot:TRINITY_DN73270_c0_g1_i1.p1 TRINITY_DN73270_c0_g1~~TRINITY_DN73270_c0_g1_i1.p1  ORF type:complete len:406 (-),score=64.53 TRINITY_DN73270_c0_g1_i1:45-1262(-)